MYFKTIILINFFIKAKNEEGMLVESPCRNLLNKLLLLYHYNVVYKLQTDLFINFHHHTDPTRQANSGLCYTFLMK